MKNRGFHSGLLFKLASTFFYTIMLYCIKISSAHGSMGQILFFRSAIGLIPVFIWLYWSKQLAESLSVRSPSLILKRTLFGCGAMFFASAALKYLPVTYALSISYLAPLMIVILAAWILKESVSWLRWCAVVIGFFGVAIMLTAAFHEKDATLAWTVMLFGGGLAFLGALSNACATIEIRRLKEIPSGTLILSFMFSSALIMLFSVFSWTVLPVWQWMILGVCGVSAGLAQIFMMMSIQSADASVLAPFEYTTLLWSLLFSVAGFGPLPNAWTLFGGAIVVVAGLMAASAGSRNKSVSQKP